MIFYPDKNEKIGTRIFFESADSLDFIDFFEKWNELQNLETPQIHVNMCRWLLESWKKGNRRLVLCAFRNAGKSTVIGLFCAWLLSCEPNLRILVWAADHALARKMVRNVKKIIEKHPFTKNLIPPRSQQWASDQFTVNRTGEYRDPSMLAKGIGSNVTGSRADIVICDDVEVPNTCDSAAKRRDLRERLAEIDYVLVPGGLSLYIGTPHSISTIYRTDNENDRTEEMDESPFLTGYQKLMLPVIDDNGNSAWPERFPPEIIEEIRTQTGPKKFSSQMLLKPTNLKEARLDADLLNWYDCDLVFRQSNGQSCLMVDGQKLRSVSCCWDPSFGSPDKGDASVVAVVYTSESGAYWLHAIRYITHEPSLLTTTDAATQLCQQVVAFAEHHHVPAVGIETNGLGRFLPGLLRREFAEAGLACAVIERTSSRQKALRILDAFDPILAARRLHVHASVRSTPFLQEIREWRPGEHGHDDGLDAVAACLLLEPVRLPRRAPDGPMRAASGAWRPGSKPVAAQTDFTP